MNVLFIKLHVKLNQILEKFSQKVLHLLLMTKLLLEAINLLKDIVKMVLTLRLQPIPHIM
ncbi:hypothetical protein C5749_05680 [Sphingobacterium gobiense]|uniref:Uncharacterized protein n=1 Tax=Sphingobacterium gobiense TaxID=1382456 RepID=A0A2S9JU00_9SPHI|nr:hypothetical protein C5749_05680 [Sphingobacterium gobiense]